MKNIVTLFPNYQDIHFYKDPGQIPYRFKRKGFNVYILRFANDKKCPITKSKINIIEIPKKRLGYGILSVWKYMKKNARKIDILNLFHINFQSIFAAFVYKKINKKGFVYLKMDNCKYSGYYRWEKIYDDSISIINEWNEENSNVKDIIKKWLMKKQIKNIDMFSVEDNASCEYYSKKYEFIKNNIIISFNGHTIDLFDVKKPRKYEDKEDIICSVGRFGNYQKATNILLNAFAKTIDRHEWNLMLAGNIEENYKKEIEKFFSYNPLMKSRVNILGYLNKKDLFEIYNKSKIFCLPSRYETFANVYSEAMYYKNAIITTPTTSVKDIIEEYRMGILVDVDNVDQLSQKIIYLINNPSLIQQYGENAKAFCDEYLSWDVITDKILAEINKKCENKIYSVP